MSTDIPTEAVEAAVQAIRDSLQFPDSAPADAWPRIAKIALTAAAPLIADSVRRELLADTYTAEGGEIVMRELGRVKAERDELRARIEALRDEWREATVRCRERDGQVFDHPKAEYLYRCADALDALLPERAR